MQFKNTPTPKNATDEVLLKVLEEQSEPPSPEFIAEFAKELSIQVDETTSQVEAVIEKRVSLSEAQEILGESFDLETALAQSRLSEEDKEALRKDPELISEEDLRKLKENPALGGQVFFTVRDTEKDWNEIFSDRFKELQAVIGSNHTYVWRSFIEYKRVNSDEKELENQKPAKACSVTFTPDVLNLTDNTLPSEVQKLVGINAYQQREKMAQGVKFLEPDVWMDMFQRGLDNLVVDYDKEITDLEALHALDENEYANKCQTALRKATDEQIKKFLPDSKTVTQFPDMADKNGVVPSLDFFPGGREVYLF